MVWPMVAAGTSNDAIKIARDMAPDFVLPTVNRKSQVRLSSFRGKQPVVLVFGSYT